MSRTRSTTLSLLALASSITIAASLTACGGSSRMADSSPGSAAARAPATTSMPERWAPSAQGFTPIGVGQSSTGLRDLLSTTGDSAVGFDPNMSFGSAAPARTTAPRTDLRSTATEELWVIQRAPETALPVADNHPGCGGLLTQLTPDAAPVPVPLRHTDVRASVAGHISTVSVTQQFHNPYSSKIEAVYVFPLPDNAAVNEFLMTVGDRTIRGVIRERAEAQQIYDQAKSQGHVASLMTQERPNVFTQHVANIEPGRAIDIDVTYFSTLTYHDGAGGYEFVFPMVVGPRFNPSATTDGVGAAQRNRPGSTRGGGQPTEVQYLRPTERSGHDISLTLDIDAGVPIETVESRTHAIAVHRPGPTRAQVRLSPSDSIPNRDFVLRYRVAGDSIKSGLLAHRGEKGGHFTLMLVPPAGLERLDRVPLEMVFVLDTSGSMSGQPLDQAKSAIRRGLKSLRPSDSFQVIDFSDAASQLGPSPLDATPDNIARGLAHVDRLGAGGGTMMITGIKAALDYPHDPERLRFVTFLTDGYIGNESEILGAMHQRLGRSRVFSFGVGPSVNRALMESMARMGRGVVAYLNLADPATEVMDLFLDRVSHPALTDLALETSDSGARITDVYPARLPDLFVGRPVVITGRFAGELPPTIRVTGRAAGRPMTIDVPVQPASTAAAAALPAVWARAKIADLDETATYQPSDHLESETRQTALAYGIMSRFTAFVAVDSLTRTAGAHGTTVAVPVPVPEGVRYETTVPGEPTTRPVHAPH